MGDLPPIGGFLASADFYATYSLPDGLKSLAYYKMRDGTHWRHGYCADAGGWGWARVQ